MRYLWYSLRGREALSHVFWPGFGVMFLYSFIMGQLNSPFITLPARAWMVMSVGAIAFAIWLCVALWQCAYNLRWRFIGHLVRGGIICYLAAVAWIWMEHGGLLEITHSH